MTGKQRVAAAMSAHRTGLLPDRTPVMCQLSLGHMYRYAGIGPTAFWRTSQGLADASAALCDAYGFDGILVSKTGRPAPPAEVRATPRDGGMEVAYEDGAVWFYPPDEYPAIVGAAKARRQLTVQDVSEGDVPRKTLASLPPYHADVLAEVIAQRGGTHSVHGEVGTAFEGLLNLFGSYEAGLMALLDGPGLCRGLMRLLNENVLVETAWQCDMAIDAMKLSSPLAGGGLISRAMYEEWVLPYEAAVVDFVHKRAGLPCYIHTCGSIGDRLDLILQTGVDGVECLDPPPLGNVRFTDAVRALAGRAFLKGNIDAVNELSRPVPEVTALARERIRQAEPLGGAYILSTACSVSPRVPMEHVRALRAAAEQSAGWA